MKQEHKNLLKEKEELLKQLEQFSKPEQKQEKTKVPKLKQLTQFAQTINLDAKREPQTIQSDRKTVSEILQLNEKLISTLEQVDGQLDALTQLNTKLTSDLQEKEATITAYKQEKLAAEQAKFNERLNTVTERWCEVFSISDNKARTEARQMLSTFQSEDKLAEVENMLAHKMSVMSNQPKHLTKTSSELVQPVQKSIKQKSVYDMTPKEKQQYVENLFKNHMQ